MSGFCHIPRWGRSDFPSLAILPLLLFFFFISFLFFLFLIQRVTNTADVTLPPQPFWFLFKYYPAVPQDYKASSQYLGNLTGLLTSGTVVPVPHRLMAGGLADIGKGFDEMKAGRVRGQKLVYEVGGGS